MYCQTYFKTNICQVVFEYYSVVWTQLWGGFCGLRLGWAALTIKCLADRMVLNLTAECPAKHTHDNTESCVTALLDTR